MGFILPLPGKEGEKESLGIFCASVSSFVRAGDGGAMPLFCDGHLNR